MVKDAWWVIDSVLVSGPRVLADYLPGSTLNVLPTLVGSTIYRVAVVEHLLNDPTGCNPNAVTVAVSPSVRVIETTVPAGPALTDVPVTAEPSPSAQATTAEWTAVSAKPIGSARASNPVKIKITVAGGSSERVTGLAGVSWGQGTTLSASRTVASKNKGSVTVTLPPLKAGTYKVKPWFTDESGRFAQSRGKTITITVRR
ncbi:MAG: hypothetical protein LBJ08_07620 [Bifidobacteriaceae bacterium]|nr:hypothetical protein [Bifidobacteriaceae bacterium]